MLTLPSCHRGPAVGLQRELDRRIRCGEPGFEFFAPSYVEVKDEEGHFVRTRRPLLYNYVFVRSSESEIYRMKQELPQYNFLPRVREGLRGYYPYLSDEAMRNLQWVARSYCDELPVYMPETERLAKGDRIRIIAGRFKGAEARVAIRPGGGRKDVVVCVENWMWVPLLHVRPGEYEIIALHEGGKHVYTRLDNDRLQEGLHELWALPLPGRRDGRRSRLGGRNDQTIRPTASRQRCVAQQTLLHTASGLHVARREERARKADRDDPTPASARPCRTGSCEFARHIVRMRG